MQWTPLTPTGDCCKGKSYHVWVQAREIAEAEAGTCFDFSADIMLTVPSSSPPLSPSLSVSCFFFSSWSLKFVRIVDEHANVQYNCDQSVWFGRPKGLLSSFSRAGAAFKMACEIAAVKASVVMETLPGTRSTDSKQKFNGLALNKYWIRCCTSKQVMHMTKARNEKRNLILATFIGAAVLEQICRGRH